MLSSDVTSKNIDVLYIYIYIYIYRTFLSDISIVQNHSALFDCYWSNGVDCLPYYSCEHCSTRERITQSACCIKVHLIQSSVIMHAYHAK